VTQASNRKSVQFTFIRHSSPIRKWMYRRNTISHSQPLCDT